MKTKWFSAALIVLTAAMLAIKLRNQPNPVAPQQAATPLPPAAVVADTPPAPAESVAPATAAIQAKKPEVPIASIPQNPPQKQLQKPAKEPLRDPEARDALALVGVDSDAEAYWLDAIYDSSLPDKEREDLMEDLNEVGFADPKNLTADDLPLIVSRLQLIEDIAPNTDPFMAEHLGEAYKDLANMYNRVSRQFIR